MRYVQWMRCISTHMRCNWLWIVWSLHTNNCIFPTVTDICPPDKFGFMPWECIGVEWDEGGPEPFARINPW